MVVDPVMAMDPDTGIEMVGSRRSVIGAGLFIGRMGYLAMRNAIRNFVLTAAGFPACIGGL
jgi:hypothetical protein